MVLRRLEERLERLVEGAFASAFRGGVQPIEVGQRILRAMDNRQFVGLDGPIVANDFLVHLNPKDYADLAPLLGGLIPEFALAAAGHTREHGYHLVGPIHITIEAAETTRRGLVDVSASALSDVIATPWPAQPNQAQRPPPQAPVAPPAAPGALLAHEQVAAADRYTGSPFAPPGPGAAPPAAASLDRHGPPSESAPAHGADTATREPAGFFGVLEFPDGHRRTIDRIEYLIGRLPACDLTLSDQNASRRHAAITTLHGITSIRDLGSTNGTSVNGRTIEGSVELHHGDRVTVGITTLRFGAPA